jgi:hypothetical protein
LLSEWAEGASYVSEHDDDLADIWRDLLKDILNGTIPSKLIIDKLKQLKNYEAALLARMSTMKRYEPQTNHEQHIISSLQDKNLVEKDPLFIIGTIVGTSIFCVLLFGGFVIFIVLWITRVLLSPVFNIILLSMICTVALALGIPVGINVVGKLIGCSETKYRLTWLGQQIVRPLKRQEFSESLKQLRKLWHETSIQESFLGIGQRLIARLSHLLTKLTKRSKRPPESGGS